jgi:hypothetical protein
MRQAVMDSYGMRASPGQSLSLEEMRARLPAIFATQPHESRSERYVYVSTEDVMEALMEEGFKPVEARVARSRLDGRQAFAKHLVRLRLDGEPAKRQVGDTALEVILRNAHDGTAAYEIMAGLFRLICLNGMAVSDGTIEAAHVRHSGSKQKQLEQVVSGAFQIIEHAPLALEAPRLWPKIDLSRDEQMVLADGARTLRFGDAEGHVETPIEASQLLHPRRPADEGNDLWRTFNRIQENVTKGGVGYTSRDTRGRARRVSTREVKGIDGDLKLNRALWTLGAEMAKLKQAA